MENKIKIITSVLLITIPVMYFGIMGNPSEMLISLFAGFTCAFIINLNKFSYFKAGSLEAKLREAEEVIQEANATIENLKEMSIPLMNYALTDIIRGNHIHGVGGSAKEKVYLSTLENVNQFEINNEETFELLVKVKRDFIKTYFEEIELKIEECVGWADTEPFREFVNKHIDNPPNVFYIRSFLEAHPQFIREPVKKAIEEYERVMTNYS